MQSEQTLEPLQIAMMKDVKYHMFNLLVELDGYLRQKPLSTSDLSEVLGKLKGGLIWLDRLSRPMSDQAMQWAWYALNEGEGIVPCV